MLIKLKKLSLTGYGLCIFMKPDKGKENQNGGVKIASEFTGGKK